ncbi:MAG: hypothetical protein AAGD35_18900 [Actinomycetota bacterium]
MVGSVLVSPMLAAPSGAFEAGGCLPAEKFLLDTAPDTFRFTVSDVAPPGWRLNIGARAGNNEVNFWYNDGGGQYCKVILKSSRLDRDWAPGYHKTDRDIWVEKNDVADSVIREGVSTSWAPFKTAIGAGRVCFVSAGGFAAVTHVPSDFDINSFAKKHCNGQHTRTSFPRYKYVGDTGSSAVCDATGDVPTSAKVKRVSGNQKFRTYTSSAVWYGTAGCWVKSGNLKSGRYTCHYGSLGVSDPKPGESKTCLQDFGSTFAANCSVAKLPKWADGKAEKEANFLLMSSKRRKVTVFYGKNGCYQRVNVQLNWSGISRAYVWAQSCTPQGLHPAKVNRVEGAKCFFSSNLERSLPS